MLVHLLDDNSLIKVISSGFLTLDELDIIKSKLEFLFEAEDEFNSYSDSLSYTERSDLEYDGLLFPSIWPFKPFLLLDEIQHQKLISFIVLSEIGVRFFGDYSSDIDIYDEDGLKKDIITLIGIKK